MDVLYKMWEWLSNIINKPIDDDLEMLYGNTLTTGEVIIEPGSEGLIYSLIDDDMDVEEAKTKTE